MTLRARHGVEEVRGAVQGPEYRTGAITSRQLSISSLFILYVRTHKTSGQSYLCFSLQQVTCKSKYDVGVDEDRPQLYDAGVGLPISGRTR